MKKKLLSILLATFMVLTLVPATIFADTGLTELAITANYDNVDITDKNTFITTISSTPDLESNADHQLYLCNGDDCVYLYNYASGKWNDENGKIQFSDVVLDDIDNIYYRLDYDLNGTGYMVEGISSITITVDGKEIGEYEEESADYKYLDDTHLYIYHTIYKSGDDKTGSTTITATVPEPTLVYDIVIPASTTINSYGVHKVGGDNGVAPHVDVKSGAKDTTVISYTATTSNFTKSGSNDVMVASYYTDSEGKSPFPSTAVEVYKNKANVNPLTEMYVGITQTDWETATPGTYNATVTFNFTDTERVSLATLIATNPEFPTSYSTAWSGSNGVVYSSDGKLCYNANEESIRIDLNTTKATLDKSTNTYKFTWAELDNAEIEFILENNVLTIIKVAGDACYKRV